MDPAQLAPCIPLQLLTSNALAQKEYAAAVDYGTRALALSEKEPGDTNPEIFNCLSMMAVVYRQQQAFDKAKPYLARAVSINERLYGAMDFHAVIPMYALCQAEDHVDGPEVTEACYRKLLAGMEAIYGPNNPATANALHGYAQSLRKLGKNDEAAKIEERVKSMPTPDP